MCLAYLVFSVSVLPCLDLGSGAGLVHAPTRHPQTLYLEQAVQSQCSELLLSLLSQEQSPPMFGAGFLYCL